MKNVILIVLMTMSGTFSFAQTNDLNEEKDNLSTCSLSKSRKEIYNSRGALMIIQVQVENLSLCTAEGLSELLWRESLKNRSRLIELHLNGFVLSAWHSAARHMALDAKNIRLEGSTYDPTCFEVLPDDPEYNLECENDYKSTVTIAQRFIIETKFAR